MVAFNLQPLPSPLLINRQHYQARSQVSIFGKKQEQCLHCWQLVRSENNLFITCSCSPHPNTGKFLLLCKHVCGAFPESLVPVIHTGLPSGPGQRMCHWHKCWLISQLAVKRIALFIWISSILEKELLAIPITRSLWEGESLQAFLQLLWLDLRRWTEAVGEPASLYAATRPQAASSGTEALVPMGHPRPDCQ